MEYFYEWTQNLAFYMVIVTMVIQIIPNDSYKKYIRFFVGLILIVMLSGPVLRIFDMKEAFVEFYRKAQEQQSELERIWEDEKDRLEK